MICSKVENELKFVPKGNLRISKDKNKIRYYHCVEDNEGTYISKIDSELPKLLAQKKYNQSVLKKAKARLRQIERITRAIPMMKLKRFIHRCIHKGSY